METSNVVLKATYFQRNARIMESAYSFSFFNLESDLTSNKSRSIYLMESADTFSFFNLESDLN
jgi:hypothetical protein